jgi:hypothetical protein
MHLRQRGQLVELAVVERNERALALYRRCGSVDAGSDDNCGRGAPTERKRVYTLDAR